MNFKVIFFYQVKKLIEATYQSKEKEEGNDNNDWIEQVDRSTQTADDDQDDLQRSTEQKKPEGDLTFANQSFTNESSKQLEITFMLESATKKSEVLEGEQRRLLAEIERGKQEIKELSSKLGTSENEKSKMKTSLKNAQQEKNNADKLADQLKAKLKESENSKKKLEEEKQRVENEYDTLEDKVKAAKTDLLRYKERVDELERENNKLAEDADKEADKRFEKRLQALRQQYEDKLADSALKRNEERTRAEETIKELESIYSVKLSQLKEENKKLELHISKETPLNQNLGINHKQAFEELKDYLKFFEMPWLNMSATSIAQLDPDNSKFVVGYREGKDTKLGIFDYENLTDYDKGFGEEIRSELSGTILDICILNKNSFIAAFVDNSSKDEACYMLIWEEPNLQMEKKKFKSRYSSNSKEPPQAFNRIYQKHKGKIYYIESGNRIAKMYQQYGKWQTKVDTSQLKDLQQMKITDGTMFLLSRSKVARRDLETNEEMGKDICGEGSILTAFDTVEDVLIAASVVKETMDSKTSNYVYLFRSNDLMPLNHLEITDLNHHFSKVQILKVKNSSVILLVEGSERPRVAFLSIQKESLVRLITFSNMFRGVVRGFLPYKTELIMYGQSYDPEEPPKFKFLKLI